MMGHCEDIIKERERIEECVDHRILNLGITIEKRKEKRVLVVLYRLNEEGGGRNRPFHQF